MNKSDKKILVVDDDLNLLELLIDTLKTIEYNVVGVDNGLEALEILKSEHFDLVISDIKMPQMDGFALLKEIRKDFPSLPFFFITGVNSPEIVAKATVNGILSKPFRISHIEQLIEDTLSGKSDKLKKSVRNLLLVDDDETYLDLMTETFARHNYSTFSVSNAKEAIEQLSLEKIDAVITDIKMPEMDGFQLTRKVKEAYPEIPVFLITAFSDASEFENQIRNCDADGFFEKSNEIENLVSLINSLPD